MGEYVRGIKMSNRHLQIAMRRKYSSGQNPGNSQKPKNSETQKHKPMKDLIWISFTNDLSETVKCPCMASPLLHQHYGSGYDIIAQSHE